ncbi:MAG TPA: PhnD/SsuA/transferrin family substrate-binding protein [Bradyrhizobium sp.]|nr:PhnD/SsuA/transferrin family substrate-binding protein [Bradyrhizobium sp.]
MTCAATLKLTYGGSIYDRTRMLFTGEVRPTGVDLTCFALPIEELFWRQGRYGDFDVAEYSMGAYVASVEDPGYQFIALPVFPSRVFRHSAIYVHADAGISSPRVLEGRAVGTPEWSMTGSLWARGILGEHYGVDLTAIRWRTGGLDQAGRREKSRIVPPEAFNVRPLPESQTLGQALLDREIDAIISARPPALFLKGHEKIRPLFRSYRSEEAGYFRATRIFPIMHVVIMRKSLVAEHPWLAGNLRSAFEAARKPAIHQLLDSAVCTTSLVWEASYAEEERNLMGDPFVYGVEENGATLSALCRYAHQQGFTSRLLEPQDLFAASTLTSARV